MRTTVNIDEDVLLAVRGLARREKRSVGAVLSELARRALAGGVPGSDRSEVEFHGFRPLPHRGGIVTNDLIDRLREDEAE